MSRLRAWRLGIPDGIEQPHDLTMGRTWTADDTGGDLERAFDLNAAYDRGVNLGQLVGRLIERAKRTGIWRYLP